MQPIGLLTLTAQPDELLRRDRAGRLPRRQPGARASTSPTTRCSRRGCSPTSTPSSPGWAARTSPRSRSTARTRRSTTCCATASTRTPCTAAWRRTGRTRWTAAARSTPPAPRTGRSSTCRPRWPRRSRSARGTGVVRRPLQPGAAVLAEHDAGGEGAHRRGVHLRAGQVLRAGDQGAPAAGAGQHRPRPVRAGRRGPRPAGAGGDRAAGRPRARARRCPSSARPGRPTAG